jgi:hypothetical protein
MTVNHSCRTVLDLNLLLFVKSLNGSIGTESTITSKADSLLVFSHITDN